MATSVGRSNPYIGPRAFQLGERIHGREHEAYQLMNLIIAERIVLLYSPSGAGKTSLIQAALIPRLLKNRFQVLPVVRISLDSAGPRGDRPELNRYVYSALLSLDEGLPRTQQTEPDELARMSLPDYLARRSKPEGALDIQVIIFDQFEEVLTLDPTDLVAKQEFFRQVGDALEAPNRWALFSMREDYVAALDPYRLPIPSRLATTFRLDLLSQEAARQAIQQPARQSGVEFEDAAAEKLVDDLRRVRVQQLDGSVEPQLGPYVEPVQLQVVCHRLWETPRLDPRRISPQDLVAFGQVDQSLVDQSLAEYYAEQVAAVATETGTSERRIREWFSRQLITEQGVRGTVLMGKERSGGLENPPIQSLVDAYLVRGEKRGGATWFELAHDRLIGPVRTDNAAWFKANLSLLQQRADVWDQQDRPESLLLRGQELVQARAWVAEHQAELLPMEVDYLAASQQQANRALRLKRRNQIISVLGIASMLLAILAWVLFRTAAHDRDKALRQERVARSGQLAAQSQAALQALPPRSMLLAVEALSVTLRTGEPRLATAENALRNALGNPHGIPLPGHTDQIKTLAFSPECDGSFGASSEVVPGSEEPCERWLATGSDDGTVRLWPVGMSDVAANALVLPGHQESVTAVAFSQEGRWLAAGSTDQTVRLWDLHVADPSVNPLLLNSPGGEVSAVAFSPKCGSASVSSGEANDGTTPECERWLAAGGLDGAVQLWDMREPKSGALPVTLSAHGGSVLTLAFSPDGRWLAAGGDDRSIRLWDMAARDVNASVRVLDKHEGVITSLAFSADGRWLASGSRDETAILWDLAAADPRAQPRVLRGHNQWVNTLAFSPDGRWLATGSGDKVVMLWDLNTPDVSASPRVLAGHEAAIKTLAFSPDSRWLASGSEDKTARVWDLAVVGSGLAPIILRGHEDWVNTLAFSSWCYNPAGVSGDRVPARTGGCTRLLATGSNDKTARLWVVDAPDLTADPVVLRSHRDRVNALAFSSDGRWLASGGGDPASDNTDNDVRLWDVGGAGPAPDPILLSGHTKWISALAFGSGCDKPSGAPGTADSGTTKPCPQWLASGSGDSTIRLWDLSAGDAFNSPRVLTGHVGAITALAFRPRCASSSGASNETTQANAEPCAHWLATGSQDETARLWDPLAANPGGSRVLSGFESGVKPLAISPDGRWLAANSDYTTSLLDLSAVGADPITPTYTLHEHRDIVASLAFSPDSRWLATGGSWGDKTVRVWDLKTANPVAASTILSGPQDEVSVLAFSPGCDAPSEAPIDGCNRWLAAGSKDKDAFVWRLGDDGPVGIPFVLHGHLLPITALAFSADGNWLATGSDDQTTRLWNLRSPNPAAQPVVLQGHAAGITSLAFSPDARWLATGSKDGTVRLWSLSLDHLIALACSGAGRNLTQDEWIEFFPGEPYHKTCPQWP